MLLVIPTYNAGEKWSQVIESIKIQDLKPLKVLVIDSGSQDETVSLAKEAGWMVKEIQKSEFNHGLTRQSAISECDPDDEFVIFMTQDAICADPSSLSNLIKGFEVDPKVALVYGRQLPHLDATPLAAQARLFNYPPISQLKKFEDRHRLGIKTPFCSNSFAAYRLSNMKYVGGFSKTNFGEDMLIAAKFLIKNYFIFYQAEACVHHSHNFTILEESKRYFEIGKFHAIKKNEIFEFNDVTKAGLSELFGQFRTLDSDLLFIIKFFISVTNKIIFYSSGSLYAKWSKR